MQRSNDVERFRVFVGYIAFSLIRRCVIRPGAMTFMTVEEFHKPIKAGTSSVLVHVKGM